MAKHAGSVFSVDVTGLDRDAGQPAYARISERIRTAILSGALVPNARLPSGRTLARDLGVSRNTVDWALDQLVADGYIVRRRGAGSFVAAQLPERDSAPLRPERSLIIVADTAPRRISRRAEALRAYPGHYEPASSVPFTPSLPPMGLFPRDVWNRLLQREAAKPGDDYWHYGASNGLPALRRAIAAHASAMRAVRCSPEQVIVVTSTQQAVELAAKSLADSGDRAWCELPGYPPVRHGLRNAGLEVVDVPVDDDGLDVAAGLAAAPDARLAYVTPAHQYPLGVELSLARRHALLDWAHERDAYVLEDDYDGDYRYEGRPIASLQGMDERGRVIYIGSFNKILFPSLRIAYAIVPEPLVDAIVGAKHIADGHTALLMQGVLAAFIDEGHLGHHLRKTRSIYDQRRQAFLEEAKMLEHWLNFRRAISGMHITARFNEAAIRVEDRIVAEICFDEGLIVHPLSRYGEASNPGGLVFGFAGSDREQIHDKLKIVKAALSKLDKRPRGR
ncbi:PLP-dependent aminotransferase family protein [Lysobacter enzymogenes]|uniref:MocR-like pyridoxine biosynthesis transcription factor PdxR n=1 Tax=Lysobacter enzymogenes TaxID=69 RepID=UPI001A97D31F|nr:PLP-dependent aminotransferase family protein [Lysobacter enzymogenes]QQP94344.1 PLP-dependent aminotransferase family protein [Lysobacter enzymogenes]